jgi:hypothetical protein
MYCDSRWHHSTNFQNSQELKPGVLGLAPKFQVSQGTTSTCRAPARYQRYLAGARTVLVGTKQHCLVTSNIAGYQLLGTNRHLRYLAEAMPPQCDLWDLLAFAFDMGFSMS